MTKIARFAHKFVEPIPERLEEGVLYISIHYATGMHLCACGCGHQVVTPLSPTDWEMTFDGETVSLAFTDALPVSKKIGIENMPLISGTCSASRYAMRARSGSR